MAGVVLGSAAGEEDKSAERAAGRPAKPPTESAVDRLTLRQQVGQLLVSSFDEPTAPDYIRRRLGAGETAGVILFVRNGGSQQHWRELTLSLQRAARGRALVMVDQEGGPVRTVSFAGPPAGQPFQGAPAAVRGAARDAGRELRSVGVNVNLAPVADVAAPGSALRSRVFAGDAATVAASTRAAVAGMRAAQVAATAKHFPGLGGASVNTDDASATVDVPRSTLGGRDLPPFRAAVDERVPLVMLSHALFPALDRERIASQSRAIATDLLRRDLGFDGVAVTDSMEAQAVLDRSGIATAAERSIEAGADLILMTGSASWNEVFPRLLERAEESASFRRRVRESAGRVLALKRLLR
ncbi:MAG TPA: glycoside hydrolase family 3 N-terminal domain-containing protein [Thermoleophilaceae bacterium]|nr:glycoside hydrolase family 3 N-terminal domain-containing protein [Thermoleophilaceae bacterium]